MIKAKYQISDTFNITGRGIVFAGVILEGEISIGDYIEFNVFDKVFKRKIIGIEGIASSQITKMNTGLLIQCTDDKEIQELRKWTPKDIVGFVYR
ncbi:hypothetical protein [Tenacibaculum sp. M341]|uniref:hypothetical protein n=1 Tax=Tenacibaculum sp. M341 TaxID=2530339 RepID=UPI0010536921|nr:hypothetical protein [Tenacibaculum sp. M341]TCI91797.1 hypothetical protein EYW44_09600 [Tenacibaculum sp. M341]